MNPLNALAEWWTAFPHLEETLPASLGISREALRELREKHLVDGTDWILKKKRVRLSEAGLAKLRQVLQLPSATVPASEVEQQIAGGLPPEKSAPPGGNAPAGGDTPPLQPGVIVLHVWQTVRNNRILEAFKPGTDPAVRSNILRVRVRDSKNFIRSVHGKPMAVRARHLQADLYELVGACPRRKGIY